MIKRFFPRWDAMPPALRIYGLAIRETMRPGVVERPDGAQRFLVMYFHDEALIGAGGARAFRPPGSLIVFPPGSAHAYGHPRQAWNHSWLAVDGTFFERQLRAQGIPVGAVLSGGDAASVEHNLLCIHRELDAADVPDSVILRNTLQNWFREIKRALAGPYTSPAVPRRYADLKRILGESFERGMDLDTMAARLHVSRWHLCREFKKHFGLSPVSCLLKIRMQHAAHLIRDPNLNVSEIARSVGYDDVFHFSKLFKKHYGMSPRHMRQKIWSSVRIATDVSTDR